MPRKLFRKQMVVSSILTAAAIVVIVCFCLWVFKKYTPPNKNNTSMIQGTVTEVYHGAPRGDITVVMSNGVSLRLVYPTGTWELYSAIGYDVEELADLLEGKSIECRRMDRLPWVVEIYVGDTKIDNTELTTKQMLVTRGGAVVLGLMILSFVVAGDVEYLKSKYQCYRKAQKRRNVKQKE